MKKLIMGISFILATGLVTECFAQEVTTVTTTTRHGRVRYYYYPSTNVYSNPTTGDYWYYDEPTTKWVTVKSLPSTITVSDDDRNTVYYTDDPWKHNTYDRKRYKVKKNGVIKEKTAN